jgi:hypothetical protein
MAGHIGAVAKNLMPLVRIDVADAWSEKDLQALLDEVHEAVVHGRSEGC